MATLFVIFFIVASLVLLALDLRKASAIEEPDKYLTAKHDILRTYGGAVGGLVLLAGVFLSWQTFSAQRQEFASSRFDERFATSVSQLGASDESVRMGAIVILRRISREHPETRSEIQELLSGFVRYRADATSRGSALRAGRGWPSADIRAAIEAIGELDSPGEVSPMPDLSCIDMAGADLSGLDFSGLVLDGADFSRAVLDQARFVGSKMRGARFDGSVFEAAHFDDADLHDATFDNVEIQGGFFTGAVMHNVKMRSAKVYSADFSRAELHTAEISGGENLVGLNLNEAYIYGAKFSGDFLAERDFSGAFGDIGTTIPPLIRRPDSWSKHKHADEEEPQLVLCDGSGKEDVRAVVVFDTGRALLSPLDLARLQEAAAKLREDLSADPEATVRVVGYADSVGDLARNEILATSRAASVVSALMQVGVPGARIELLGMGERHAQRAAGPEFPSELERRVEVFLVRGRSRPVITH